MPTKKEEEFYQESTIKVEQPNGYFMPKVEEVYYAHYYYISGQIDCFQWEGGAADFSALLDGNVFPTKEAAEAADFEAIKHRIEVIATVNAIYQKHKVRGWELEPRNTFHAPCYHSIDYRFSIGTYFTTTSIPHKFPYTNEGRKAADAFLAEVGHDRYLEYCKLISL